MVSEAYYEVHMTRVLHTAQILLGSAMSMYSLAITPFFIKVKQILLQLALYYFALKYSKIVWAYQIRNLGR